MLPTLSGLRSPARCPGGPAASTDLRMLRASRQLLQCGSRSAFPWSSRRAASSHIAHAKKDKKKDEGGPYSATVRVPTTSFNLRANSAVREPEIQAWWEEQGVYQTLAQHNPGAPFTLHDGPPYANGDLHIGHALNKMLKDFINRYQLLQGRKARFVPGWDTHGLPIELKVLQSLPAEQRKSLDTLSLRAKAREFALKTLDAQRTQFKRYGVWGDWDSPYVTLDPAYEAAQLGVFGQMVLRGHIYRGLKPVHWSPSSRTALAEAELEYPEGHVSRSCYVAMALVAAGPQVPADLAAQLMGEGGAGFGIWTTTPWTIPANLAVAVNGDLDYQLVEAQGEGAAGWSLKRFVVAADLAEGLAAKFGVTLAPLASFKGSVLEGCTYKHPLYDRTSPVVIGGDYITTESGTGLVHTAPGHGQEDYQVGQRYGLPLLSPVDDAGCFTSEAGEAFAGLAVQGEGNTAVLEALSAAGVLLKEEPYAHKYPYDWRTKKPTIFRATSQWFASVEGFRQEALDAIGGVSWVPGVGQNRITAMTEGRSDWCISRQRKWGVPIPVFYDLETDEPLLTQDTMAHVQQLVAAHGSDIWWTAPLEQLLPPSMAHLAPRLRKGEDTMDVWFDSGSSWAGVVQAGAERGLAFPADLYLEGSDQHRGWFQSSLLTAVAATGVAPYKQVLTHGFVLDERGFKMSKSLGNVVDPRAVITGGKDAKKDPAYGADVLRLWVASVDYSNDVMIGAGILKQVAEAYRKLRGTLRFLLGNLADFDPVKHSVPFDQLPAVDRWLLARHAAVMAEVAEAYDSYQFRRVYQVLLGYVAGELSALYLDTSKDRLYIQAPGSASRRACQTVQAEVLKGLLSALAPLVPHMAEDAWLNMPEVLRTPNATTTSSSSSNGSADSQAGPSSSSSSSSSSSVFAAGWAVPDPAWGALEAFDQAAWGALQGVRDVLNAALEAARADKVLGSSLEAAVAVHVSSDEVAAWLQRLNASGNAADELRYLFIVSEAGVVGSAAAAAEGAAVVRSSEVEGAGVVTVGVRRAAGRKCERCWNYSSQVGAVGSQHPDLCERCTPVVQEMGFVLPAAVASAAAAGPQKAVPVAAGSKTSS